MNDKQEIDFSEYKISSSKKGDCKFKQKGTDLKSLFCRILKGRLYIKLELFDSLNSEVAYIFCITPTSGKVYQIVIEGYKPGIQIFPGIISLWEQQINKDKKIAPKRIDTKEVEIWNDKNNFIVVIPISLIKLEEGNSQFSIDEINVELRLNDEVDEDQFK